MNAPHERVLRVGPGRFDPLSGELCLDGRTVTLRPRTAAFLSHLVQHGGRIVSKDELMQVVWPNAVVTEDSLVQCVKEIRHALGASGRNWVRTLPRQGYAFVPNAPEPEGPQPAASPDVARLPPRAAARWFISAPWGRYALALAGLTVVVMLSVFWWRGHPLQRPTALPLSLVVMPLVNLTGDAVHDAAADDMTEALADAFARRGGGRVTVIAPSTAFTFKGSPVDVRRVGAELNVRYVLQGSLRMDAARPVLAMRLADVSTAVQLWSQDFASETGAMQALREEVIGRVAETLGWQLIRASARSSRRTGAVEAVELLSRARAIQRAAPKNSVEATLQARALLEQAVRHDSELASAWAMLAMTYLPQARFSSTRGQDLQRAADAVKRAVALAPDSDAVRQVEGKLYFEQGRMAHALATFEMAIERNPSNAAALASSGAALVMLGRPDEALVPIGRAMRLSPRDPLLPGWQMFAGVAHLHLGQDAAAVQWLAPAVDKNPENPFGHLFLASALGLAGRTAEAQAQIAKFQQLRPGFTLSRFREVEPSDAPLFRRQRERVYDGLRRAGMPE
jgi:adenylate cyclase